jgi:hypothetical protein
MSVVGDVVINYMRPQQLPTGAADLKRKHFASSDRLSGRNWKKMATVSQIHGRCISVSRAT